MTRILKGLVFCVALLASPACRPREALSEILLENEFWSVTVQPRWGARASSLYSRGQERDFVVNWTPSVLSRFDDAEIFTGGAFAGSMAGSFVSFRDPAGQLCLPYEVTARAPGAVTLTWEHRAPLFTGLEEERTIALSDGAPEITLDIKVTNRSGERRVIAYRFQDWLGSGGNLGHESVYVVPQSGGEIQAYTYEAATRNPARISPDPGMPWYAVADLPGDTGLLVRVAGSRVGGFVQWFPASPDPAVRTAEIFFPVTHLQPGESWRAKIVFTAFRPSAPGHIEPGIARFLSSPALTEALLAAASARTRSGPPHNARMKMFPGTTPLRVVPVHATDAFLGTGRVQDYGGTLESIHLFGTPGEAVPFALAALAGQDIAGAEFTLTDLVGGSRFRRRTIGRDNFETRFASADGHGYLLHDFSLARDLPEEVGAINNNLRDAPSLTPFSLSRGESAGIWALLRLPEDAAAGDYRGRATVSTPGGGKTGFDVKLTVYPFTLSKPPGKVYGTAFRYHLRQGAEDTRPHAASETALREALAGITRLGFRKIFLYGETDEVLWKLDRCVELGWKDAVFVIISGTAWRRLSPEQLAERYGEHGFAFFAWAMDEPRFKARGDIERMVSQYEAITASGHRPYYSSNSPFGHLFSELMPELVPDKVMNSPLFLDITRRYAAAGRDIFWYSADISYRRNEARRIARMRRGVFFWKEPVSGILDWGDDSIHPSKSDANSVGFAGSEVLHRTGRENIRQGLIDMYYLHTLEEKAKTTADETARREAEQFLAWVRARFDRDPSRHAEQMGDLSYLDNLRREAAELIIRIGRPARAGRAAPAP